jgi:putative peptidoglycan lipid II flippase
VGSARWPRAAFRIAGRLVAGKGRESGFSLLSAASLVMALLTYLRQAVVANVFGMTWQTDAYAVAMVFPTLMRLIIANSFNSTFLPVYSDVLENRGRAVADKLVSRTLTWIAVTGTLGAGVLMVFSARLITVAGPGLSAEGTALASTMLRILVPLLILVGANGTMDALLLYRSRYTAIFALRVGSVAIALLTVLLGHASFGIYVLPLAGLAGPLIVFPIGLFLTSRGGHWPRIVVDPRSRSFAMLVRMAAPVTFGSLVGFTGPIFDKMLASFLESSSVTALEYANRIKMIGQSVLIMPLITLAEVQLSKRAARGALSELKRSILDHGRWITFITLPVAIIMTTLAVPIVVTLFRRGEFTVTDARLVGYALAFYAPWLAQFGSGAVVFKGFYALKDTATPMLFGVGSMISNVLLNFILVGPLGIGGLALATTLSSTGKTAFLYWSFRRKAGPLGARKTVVEYLRLLVGGAAMVAIIEGMLAVWPIDLQASAPLIGARVAVAVVAASAGYLACAFFLGSTQVRALVSRVRSMLAG